jgi:glyoxylase-like metal-dependent hydrolase (beta-lactamase superfamily II)
MVFFRYSDVIATGDVYSTETYPVIDVARGGHVNGIIDALNDILDRAIADFRVQGGTLVVPGHGRLSDSADVGYFRDMVTIVRDRIQTMVEKGMTLAEVKAARPTFDYDPRWGRDSGEWTTDMFVEAVYRNLVDHP